MAQRTQAHRFVLASGDTLEVAVTDGFNSPRLQGSVFVEVHAVNPEGEDTDLHSVTLEVRPAPPAESYYVMDLQTYQHLTTWCHSNIVPEDADEVRDAIV